MYKNLRKNRSREQHKSAPYLSLKNSKRISKYQSILFYSTQKTQVGLNWRAISDFLTHSVAKYQKMEGDPLKILKIFGKSLTMPKS